MCVFVSMCVKALSGRIYSEDWRTAGGVSSLMLETLTFCLQETAAHSHRLVTGLLFSFSWQLNTNNSMDDGPGFIVCARGGVQDTTGVINDHALCLA